MGLIIRSIVSFTSKAAVIRNWNKQNKISDYQAKIIELQEEIDSIHEYIQDLHASNVCLCGEAKRTGSMTEEICNICGKIIRK
jgi:peptidoglycan hydrolase CwlO-like protein